MPYHPRLLRAPAVIRSPQARIGTAGGQPTVGTARMRPRHSRAGRVSRSDSMAARTDMICSPGTGSGAGAGSAAPPGQTAEHPLHPVQSPLRQLRGQHQHQIVPVGKFRLHALLPEAVSQLLPGISPGPRIDGHLQGLFAVQGIAVPAQSSLQGHDLLQEGLQPSGITFQIRVQRIQRLEDQIRGAGGAEEGQGAPYLMAQGPVHFLRQMQIGGARQGREGLMGRIAADIRPQPDRMQRLRQEPQIGPVGIVHSQQHPVLMADLRQSTDIGDVAQIVGARQIDRGRLLLFQIRIQLSGAQVTGEVAAAPGGIQPPDLQIQKGCRCQKGLMGIPSGGDQRRPPLPLRMEHQKIQHGPDALGGAFRGIEGPAAEKPARVGLAAGDDPVGLIKAVGSGDLRDIQRLHAQERLSLMARHMQAQHIPGGIVPDEIADRRIHISPQEPGPRPP